MTDEKPRLRLVEPAFSDMRPAPELEFAGWLAIYSDELERDSEEVIRDFCEDQRIHLTDELAQVLRGVFDEVAAEESDEAVHGSAKTQQEDLEELIELLGSAFVVDLKTGSISAVQTGERVAVYQPARDRLQADLLIQFDGASNLDRAKALSFARSCADHCGRELKALGWKIKDAGEIEDFAVGDYYKKNIVRFMIEHTAPSPAVVATLLLGPVAPPFRFDI